MKTSKRFRAKQKARQKSLTVRADRLMESLHTRWTALAMCDGLSSEADPVIIAWILYREDHAIRQRNVEKALHYEFMLFSHVDYWSCD